MIATVTLGGNVFRLLVKAGLVAFAPQHPHWVGRSWHLMIRPHLKRLGATVEITPARNPGRRTK